MPTINLAEPGKGAAVGDTATLHGLAARQADRTPERTAVVWRNERLSFAELHRRADRLGHALRARGVGRETLVALYFERSTPAVVALLAILKTGGAYLPLDAGLPPERARTVCAAAGVARVLAGPAQCAALDGSGLPVDDLAALEQAAAGMPATPLDAGAAAGDLALVLHTSGSTGMPKAVELTHSNLLATIHAWETTHCLSSIKALAQCAHFAFAVFQSDVCRALCLGPTLVICPHEALVSPRRLVDLMRRERVGFVELVSSLARTLVAHAQDTGERLDFLEALVVGADRWFVRDHRSLARLLRPGARLTHVYGLSETTFDSTWHAGDVEDLAGHELVPLGRPFPHARVRDRFSARQPSQGASSPFVTGSRKSALVAAGSFTWLSRYVPSGCAATRTFRSATCRVMLPSSVDIAWIIAMAAAGRDATTCRSVSAPMRTSCEPVIACAPIR